jgi:hypothetical protein
VFNGVAALNLERDCLPRPRLHEYLHLCVPRSLNLSGRLVVIDVGVMVLSSVADVVSFYRE